MPTETALEIRLKGTPVWRGVLVPSTIKLPKFHAVIQSSMGWTNAHLHFFRTKFGTYEPESEEGDSWSDSMNEAEVTLDQLVGKKGDRLSYLYDFGDSWDHDLIVKAIIPCAKRRRRAECIFGEGACPPEDIGGIPGYLSLCESMSVKDHPERARFLDWLGEPFDPKAFDQSTVQKRLARLPV